MSEEQLKAFLEAVKAEEKLQEKLKSCEGPESASALAKSLGFEVASQELLEADIEGVVAGATYEGAIGTKAIMQLW